MSWKKSRGKQCLLYFTLLAPLVTCLQSASQEKVAPSGDTPRTANVIVLPPQVMLEKLPASGPYSRNPHYKFDLAQFEPALTTAAHTSLLARNYTAMTPESLKNTEAADGLKELQPLISRLAHGIVNDDAVQILSRHSTAFHNDLILVQFLKVKLGPKGGGWVRKLG